MADQLADLDIHILSVAKEPEALIPIPSLSWQSNSSKQCYTCTKLFLGEHDHAIHNVENGGHAHWMDVDIGGFIIKSLKVKDSDHVYHTKKGPKMLSVFVKAHVKLNDHGIKHLRKLDERLSYNISTHMLSIAASNMGQIAALLAAVACLNKHKDTKESVKRYKKSMMYLAKKDYKLNIKEDKTNGAIVAMFQKAARLQQHEHKFI